MKVVIVGGVAGGAGTAARLRRLDENAEIIMLERGEYISYANCGPPGADGSGIWQPLPGGCAHEQRGCFRGYREEDGAGAPRGRDL